MKRAQKRADKRRTRNEKRKTKEARENKVLTGATLGSKQKSVLRREARKSYLDEAKMSAHVKYEKIKKRAWALVLISIVGWAVCLSAIVILMGKAGYL